MFDTLTTRLGDIFDRLRRRGALSEDDVGAAMREIRVALLEADVALPVVRDFIAAAREGAVGVEVIKSVTPGQMVVKIVHDHLVQTLSGGGAGDGAIDLNAPAPIGIMLVGLQGSGKTTTAAKIALRLKTRERKKVLMAAGRAASAAQEHWPNSAASPSHLPVVGRAAGRHYPPGWIAHRRLRRVVPTPPAGSYQRRADA